MPETIAPSPATSFASFGQFRRLGTATDGGHQALEIQWDFAFLRRAPARPLAPASNARFRNTWETAVQHDETPRRDGIVAGQKPLPDGSVLMVDRRAGSIIVT